MKLHMIINDSVSKKYFRKCLTIFEIFEIFENYFFENYPLYSTYHKRGKIYWAKLSLFSQFSRILQSFAMNIYVYELCIVELCKYFNVRHRESFPMKTLLGWIHESLSPANLSTFMVAM